MFNEEAGGCIPICNESGGERFNGFECVCKDNYVRDEYYQCKKMMIPTCPEHEQYDSSRNLCICKGGFSRVNGFCTKI